MTSSIAYAAPSAETTDVDVDGVTVTHALRTGPCGEVWQSNPEAGIWEQPDGHDGMHGHAVCACGEVSYAQPNDTARFAWFQRHVIGLGAERPVRR